VNRTRGAEAAITKCLSNAKATNGKQHKHPYFKLHNVGGIGVDIARISQRANVYAYAECHV